MHLQHRWYHRLTVDQQTAEHVTTIRKSCDKFTQQQRITVLKRSLIKHLPLSRYFYTAYKTYILQDPRSIAPFLVRC